MHEGSLKDRLCFVETMEVHLSAVCRGLHILEGNDIVQHQLTPKHYEIEQYLVLQGQTNSKSYMIYRTVAFNDVEVEPQLKDRLCL